MVNSVGTNAAASLALKHLTSTNDELEQTQNRISSGLKVENARDNAAIFQVAQSLRGETAAMEVIKSGLDRAASIGDVAIAAGEAISDLLIQMREKAQSATDDGLTANQRSAFAEDFESIARQISQVVGDARFDGVSLLDGSNPNGVDFIADADGTSTLTLAAEDLSFGGTIITFTAGTSFTTATEAETALSSVQGSLSNLNSALSRLGSSTQQIENHNGFLTRLQDSLTKGVGDLVDADLGKEAALLQALQVKQQLGVQSISIANNTPQTILSLFQN